MDTTAVTPIVYERPTDVRPPLWRVRSMLEAVAWARECRLPFSPYRAAKALA